MKKIRDIMTEVMEERAKLLDEKLATVNKLLHDMSMDWAKQKRRADTYRRRALDMRRKACRDRAKFSTEITRLSIGLVNVQAENAKLRTFLAEDEKWITGLKAALEKTAFERDAAK